MTRRRYDSHSTEFGLWLRKQPEIDSKLGYIATNIDYVWQDYKTGKWMFLEEKRHGALVKWPQQGLFKLVHEQCVEDPQYQGFHIIQFQETSPDDGGTILDAHKISKEQLISFLQFKLDVLNLKR